MTAIPPKSVGMSTAHGTYASPEPKKTVAPLNYTPNVPQMTFSNVAPSVLPTQIGRKMDYYDDRPAPLDGVFLLPADIAVGALNLGSSVMEGAFILFINSFTRSASDNGFHSGADREKLINEGI